jgi:DNA-binding SARP family transcriptional activator
MIRHQKIDKNANLNDEEISRREEIAKALWEQKEPDRADIKGTLELIYLSFITLLDNRELVEDDLKEIKAKLDDCADQMIEIREKSKRKSRK